MNKICTSIKQSKHLIELGIDTSTADMRYGYIAPYEYSDRMFDGGYDEVPYPKDFLKKNPNFSEDEYDGELPAWSLGALLRVMPSRFSVKGTTYSIDIHPRNENWFIDYKCNNEEFISVHSDNLFDACYEMVCWLKENDKI